jgi:hypothetical protein
MVKVPCGYNKWFDNLYRNHAVKHELIMANYNYSLIKLVEPKFTSVLFGEVKKRIKYIVVENKKTCAVSKKKPLILWSKRGRLTKELKQELFEKYELK